MENSVLSDWCHWCAMGFYTKSPSHGKSCKFYTAKRKKQEETKEDKFLKTYKEANKRLCKAC